MRKEKRQEILNFCNVNNINVINIRNIKQSNKIRIVISIYCNECGKRYDIKWDSLKAQKFPGLCTSCAHKKSQDYKRLQVEDIICRFESEGYKVLTPISKIKPRGKRTVYFTTVEIQNKYGDIYSTNCNNFASRIDYYRELVNCDAKNERLKTESRLEYKVRMFLEELSIPYKTQFRFMDCRGKQYPLPFDFALYYKQDNRILIEVDGEQHFRDKNDGRFKELQKHDRIKNYYCKTNNIPLLRLSYKDIDNKKEIYKQKIIDFINNNQ